MMIMIKQFENGASTSNNDRHHEMYPKFQEDFRKDALALVDAFEKLGNPWIETSSLLYELNISIVMPDEVVQSIGQIKTIGENKFKHYLDQKLSILKQSISLDLQIVRQALDKPK